MTNGWVYDLFKVVVGNFPLVLFIIVGIYKLSKKIEIHLLSLQGIEKQLECMKKQMVVMEKAFEEHRKKIDQFLATLPKRQND